jgi:hypothetical protein
MAQHTHAKLMALYAEDALTTDKPWELWERKVKNEDIWAAMEINPLWHSHVSYRRIPKKWSPPEGKFYVHTMYNGVYEDVSTKSPREFGLERNTRVKANEALKEIRTFCRLLALRDQVCPHFIPDWSDETNGNYVIYYDVIAEEWEAIKYQTYRGAGPYFNYTGSEIACKMLNNGEVEL